MNVSKYLFIVLLLNVSIYGDVFQDISNQVTEVLQGSKNLVCNVLGLSQSNTFENTCFSQTESFDGADFQTIIAGRYRIATHGCGTMPYIKGRDNIGNPIYYSQRNVALLGDSLTDFAGGSDSWNLYLANGKYKVLALGAMGATSSAWREHFDNCEAGRGDFGMPPPDSGQNYRMQLPPRSIMMIGGNDIHVFKGILQPMWWLVDARHNAILNNIEAIITHHHKGNNGCGDDPDIYMKDDGKCYRKNKDEEEVQSELGRGRLFVSLGNIPAVSIDPTDPYLGAFGISAVFYALGLMDPLVYDESSENTIGKNKYQIMDQLVYTGRRLLDANVDILLKPFSRMTKLYDPLNKKGRNHAWASREMHILQNKIQEMSFHRNTFMGQFPRAIPYVSMYKSFRDPEAAKRGCYWCADKNLWMDETDKLVFKDGIHISHVKGYSRWANVVMQIMEFAGMDKPNREDTLGPPGPEWKYRDSADDWTLLLLCWYYGKCKW